MKVYTNKEPVFSEELPITETTDVGHATYINKAPIQAFENTLCNREEIKNLKEGRGNPGGVATLDDNGKVPYEQLPVPTNNLLATKAGTALDAVQGKELNDKGLQMALYVGDDGYLHFRNWQNVDTIIPIKVEALWVEHKMVSFGGAGTWKTIPIRKQPVLVAQLSDGDYTKSSFYYNGTIIRKNCMGIVSSDEIMLKSLWSEVHNFHCYIAYDETEIKVESVTFSGADTTRTIALKKKPILIVQINNLPTYTGNVGVWYDGQFRGHSNNMQSVTDTEITIRSAWNLTYTYTCYIVYEK